jgi:hypothetical protein
MSSTCLGMYPTSSKKSPCSEPDFVAIDVVDHGERLLRLPEDAHEVVPDGPERHEHNAPGAEAQRGPSCVAREVVARGSVGVPVPG